MCWILINFVLEDLGFLTAKNAKKRKGRDEIILVA